MTTGAQQRVTLPPEPRSAGVARRVLTEVLEHCGLLDVRDAAELALSELVTNAVLHAHTAVEVTVTCSEQDLRVEVRDGSSLLVPGQRPDADPSSSGEVATTGRGMALVAALTDAHGVVQEPGGGKTVWFALRRGQEPGEPDLAAWEQLDELESGVSTDEVTVTLLGFPPTLWLAASLHQDAVLREVALLGPDEPHRPGSASLAAADRARFAVRSALADVLAAARETGATVSPLPEGHPADLDAVPPVVDLPLRLAPGAATDFAALQDVLDEAQRLTLSGRMLASPALPEVVALRDWAAEQVVTLLAGEAGRPWPGADADEFTRTVEPDAASVEHDALVSGLERAIVVDSHNRIAALTGLLADELGWNAADLVGRRVVALIPPRFRESHTAGFTRHLTTGEARALDVDLRLPVLHADGSERDYGFRISALRDSTGRALYRAELAPADAQG